MVIVVYNPKGSRTQIIGLWVPNTMTSMVFGALKSHYLGPWTLGEKLTSIRRNFPANSAAEVTPSKPMYSRKAYGIGFKAYFRVLGWWLCL